MSKLYRRLEMGIRIQNAPVSPRKASIILLQTYALNNICFIHLFPLLFCLNKDNIL